MIDSSAIDVLDTLIRETAEQANRMATAFPLDYDRLNAGTGVGIRLQALNDAKAALVTTMLQEDVLQALNDAKAALVTTMLQEDAHRRRAASPRKDGDGRAEDRRCLGRPS